MSDEQPKNPPQIPWERTEDYRETYANTVQVRMSIWDFFLMFGTAEQAPEDKVNLRFFQGIYMSPQQAKAVAIILQQNVQQYENTFGEIHLEPRMIGPAGPVH